MKIRTIAILVIILTNFLIIAFSVSTGIIYVDKNIDISLKTDLSVMANIADYYISSEIKNLKLKASGIAKSLEEHDESEWTQILIKNNVDYSEFTGLAVFDYRGGIIASFGEYSALDDILNDKYIRKAFPAEDLKPGIMSFSSTYPTPKGIVFYLAAPLPSLSEKILILTLPGNYFKTLLSYFTIWQTGHIYMSDSEGYAISNPRENWINERFNYIKAADTDKAFSELSETVKLMTKGESGTAFYSVYGISRVCSFRPVSGSEEGWSLGVVAPLPESPIKDTDKGLLIVALVSIILNVIAAVIGSNFIKKPFERIEVLKEEADAANKAKSSFLSTMSHEIRTPMNAILGISEIQLLNESLPPSMRESMEKIYTSGDLLLSIINDILDLSKIEAGKLELLIDKYEIASMISDTTQLNIMRISSKPIEFELNVDENIPAQLLGDELRIKQIMNNLLSNAFKYTYSGKVELSVSAEKGRYEEEITLVIIVKDTGQGMTKEQINTLFDEYSQFNKKANRKTEGTGLGMSITRNLVHLMYGEIKIESEPDAGSVFTVRLPQGKCGSNAIGKETAENLGQFKTHKRDFMKKVKLSREPMPYGSILIVDDVDANIYVAKGLMAPYELNIASVNSGLGAIEMIKNGGIYDIIFMDHMMPEMDGIEAVSRIRNLGYNEPIIALTANAVGNQTDIFLQNGFDDYISKPIDIRLLNQILNKYIRDKQPQEVLNKVRKQRKENEKKESDLVRTKINGIDIYKGLERFGGNEEIYLDVLRTYADSVGKMLNEIENVNKNTLDIYRIKVHGIKGTSYDIFADETAKEALNLENAAKEGNYNYIEENNPSFLKNTWNLVNEINDLFKILNAQNSKPSKDKPDSDVLEYLCEACKRYDMDGADEAMTELEEYQYTSDDGLVDWLRYNVDRVYFEEIVQKLSNLT